MELHAEIISTGAPSASAYRDISRPSSPETGAREKYESRQQPGRAVLITGRIQPFALNSLPLPWLGEFRVQRPGCRRATLAKC